MKPRWILGLFYLGLLVTTILAMSLKGTAGVTLMILILFFEVWACSWTSTLVSR